MLQYSSLPNICKMKTVAWVVNTPLGHYTLAAWALVCSLALGSIVVLILPPLGLLLLTFCSLSSYQKVPGMTLPPGGKSRLGGRLRSWLWEMVARCQRGG